MAKRSILVSILLAAMAASASSAGPTAAQATDAVDSQQAAPTRGLNHVGLTVRDLDASVAFFTEALHWEIAGGDRDYPSVFVTDGEIFVTLWRASDPATATPFNRKTNIGLHHLALTVPDLETLDEVYEILRSFPGVEIEFAPEFMGDGPTTHMMVHEPSGSRIEFIVPRGRRRGEAQ